MSDIYIEPDFFSTNVAKTEAYTMPQIARDPMTVGSPPLVKLSFNTYTRRLPVSFCLFQVGDFEMDFPPKYYFLRVKSNTAKFNFTAITIGYKPII
jgi:hypothetical protein